MHLREKQIKYKSSLWQVVSVWQYKINQLSKSFFNSRIFFAWFVLVQLDIKWHYCNCLDNLIDRQC